MNRVRRLPCIASLAAVFACACGGPDPAASSSKQAAAPSTPKATAAGVAQAEAQSLFQSLCFTCHGSNGHGDGPGAAALDPKPRSFADVAWQDSVTDEHIEKVIVYGGAAVGKSAMMPAQPQLKGKAEVLGALTKIVRGFRGK